MAKGLAEAMLSERERDGTEAAVGEVASTPIAPVGDATLDFVSQPFGWSWISWSVALVVCLPVVASFGTHARQPGDQAFLYGVIFLQSPLLAGILRAIGSIFTSSLSLGPLGKLIAVGMLTFAIGALTLCSALAQTGWRGG